MAHVTGRGDDEIVGERGDFADVDLGEVLRLPVGENIDDALSNLFGFQATSPGVSTETRTSLGIDTRAASEPLLLTV